MSPSIQAKGSPIEIDFTSALAAARAKRRNPAISSLVFDFIRDLLLKTSFDESRLDWRDVNSFVMKFQQTTSPVMAKGVEDTAFYTYNRLISLNEVGGEPDQFGISLTHFHEKMQATKRNVSLIVSRPRPPMTRNVEKTCELVSMCFLSSPKNGESV